MKKNRMYKWMAAALSTTILAGLTGCDSSNPSGSGTSGGSAENWPERDITMIMPSPAGGGSDTLARLIIPFLEEEWGVKIVIENYDTALDATVAMSEAKNDGYTMGMCQNTDYGLHTVCYDLGITLDDFTFACGMTNTPMILAASEKSGIKSLDDLIAAANANPGQIVCTTSGATHLLESLMVEDALDIDISTVVRSSGSESAQALMGNNNDIGVLAAKFGSQIEEYNGTVLGIFTSERLEEYPEYATFTEQGYDVVDDVMRGWVFPAGVDQAIVDKVEATMKELTEREDYVQALAEGGEIAAFKEGAQFTQELQDYLTVAEEAYEQYPDAF
ncbi:MAG: tripartite tricarboxylate transporter substrate binding protein [Eubacteriales bacterium]